MEHQITIIICSHNRSRCLESALKSINELHSPPGLEWELVIVDNHSTDDTPDLIRTFLMECKVQARAFREEKLGLSSARNRGIDEAKGDVFAFLDDDVRVEQHWLIELSRVFGEHDPSIVGGRVLLENDSVPRPAWWCPRWEIVLGEFDLGPGVIDATDKWERLTPKYGTHLLGIGANMAFKRDIFENYGRFDTLLGRKGKSLATGEESAIVSIARRHGERMLYCGDAVVFHTAHLDRLKKAQILRHCFEVGRAGSIETRRILEAEGRELSREQLAKQLATALFRGSRIPFATLSDVLANEQVNFTDRLSTMAMMLGYCTDVTSELKDSLVRRLLDG